jgi:hypothetical protein
VPGTSSTPPWLSCAYAPISSGGIGTPPRRVRLSERRRPLDQDEREDEPVLPFMRVKVGVLALWQLRVLLPRGSGRLRRAGADARLGRPTSAPRAEARTTANAEEGGREEAGGPGSSCSSGAGACSMSPETSASTTGVQPAPACCFSAHARSGLRVRSRPAAAILPPSRPERSGARSAPPSRALRWSSRFCPRSGTGTVRAWPPNGWI